MAGKLIGYQGRNYSGRINQNLLFKSDSIYIMDNHRAALWCWLRHLNKKSKCNLIHIDRHTDTLQSRLDEWREAFTSVEDLTITDYLEKTYDNASGKYPLYQYDNYLALFLDRYCNFINTVNMFTHGEGDSPNFEEVIHVKKLIDFTDFEKVFCPIIKEEYIMNIDLDYFYTYDDTKDGYSLYVQKKDIERFFEFLKRYIDSGQIIVLTISLSPEFTNGWEEVLQLLKIINNKLGIVMGDI